MSGGLIDYEPIPTPRDGCDPFSDFSRDELTNAIERAADILAGRDLSRTYGKRVTPEEQDRYRDQRFRHWRDALLNGGAE